MKEIVPMDGLGLTLEDALCEQRGDGWSVHHVGPRASEDFASSVLSGLAQDPPALDPKWLYDAQGSELYERITGTEAYYPTRTEDALLATHAGRLRDLIGPAAVVELGSGSSTKTRHVLDAWGAPDQLHYIPIDISPSALAGAARDLARRYPGATIQALAGTYPSGLAAVASLSPKVVLFLGSSLGNFNPAQTSDFLRSLRHVMRPSDHLLLGVDRVKPPAVLERAYDDEQGWTRRFILNLFHRVNRELDANIEVQALRYEARWNATAEQVEMWVHPERPQRVVIAGQVVTLDRPILVEISRKFAPQPLQARFEGAGFQRRLRLDAPDDWFSLELLSPV